MCGIAGFYTPETVAREEALSALARMNAAQRHRGPDGDGVWVEETGHVGMAHVRLSILDLAQGSQPMATEAGTVITYNGEIYNFQELRQELGEARFHTHSDTEVILRAYEAWGAACVEKFRGMFAFALWDAQRQHLFIARDRFGIKPFYYFIQDGVFYFASEMKALLPFRHQLHTNLAALQDYFTFQFCLGEKTLFEGIHRLEPAHCGTIDASLTPKLWKYWEVQYDLDWHHTEAYFQEQVQGLLQESIRLHLRSDVEVGAYVSGGLDSSLIAALARDLAPDKPFQAFTGKFSLGPAFDESPYARMLAQSKNLTLHETDMTEADFIQQIARVIYHLDEPVAGPGSFPQFMVSRQVKDHVKVVLGGQGGDEIFGGYARYLLAYFEQCIKGAIEGTMKDGNFIVTYESIIPNLRALKNYKPLIQEFWAQGIFEERDHRYFRLINRANTLGDTIQWQLFEGKSLFEDFQSIFWGQNVEKASYFDSMTHFDFKTLLPALLHVEDRMSMAHSIESRVPFLDHRLVELVATIPSNIKFQNGELKRLLKGTFGKLLPDAIVNRQDKMGFPVPLQQWLKDSPTIRSFILDIFNSQQARGRAYLADGFNMETLLQREGPFTRNLWSLLSLELWQQQFHDVHQGQPLRVGPALIKV